VPNGVFPEDLLRHENILVEIMGIDAARVFPVLAQNRHEVIDPATLLFPGRERLQKVAIF
jgi:hypothetical protein